MKRILICLIVVTFARFSHQASSSKVIPHKVELKFDEKLINATSNLTLFPNDAYMFSLYLDLLVPVNLFFVKFSVALPSPNGKFDTIIQNSVQDVCKYFKNNNAHVFVRLFFNSKFTDKHFPSSCPIAPGHYFLEGFEIDEKFLMLRGVQTKFLILIDLCLKSSASSDEKLNCFVNIKFYGEIKDRKKWEKEIAQKRTGKM